MLFVAGHKICSHLDQALKYSPLLLRICTRGGFHRLCVSLRLVLPEREKYLQRNGWPDFHKLSGEGAFILALFSLMVNLPRSYTRVCFGSSRSGWSNWNSTLHVYHAKIVHCDTCFDGLVFLAINDREAFCTIQIQMHLTKKLTILNVLGEGWYIEMWNLVDNDDKNTIWDGGSTAP